MSKSIKVVVTGAAGQIAYSLIPRLVDGNTFGDKIVDLALVEIPQVVDKLKGLVMELEDSYFPKMGKVTYTDNFEEASKDADWFLLVGSIPRGIVYNGKKIEERSDLLSINGGIFVQQGEAIGKYGKDDAKILVVGNPANTNAFIGKDAANNDNQLWMAMTMLDSNRAKSILAKKTNNNISDVKNMIIWGNHSPTMYPDSENALISGKLGSEVINDMNFAFTVAKFINSNAIVIAKNLSTIGIGVGQTSRIDSAEQAIKRMNDNFGKTQGVLASDGFFPFPDIIKICAKNNILNIIQPGGSLNDDLVIQEAKKQKVNLVFTGTRHFKH